MMRVPSKQFIRPDYSVSWCR